MAYLDEAEVWKCPTHPSKRRRHGVCPLCLRDKLVNLCQNCAIVRPCDCPEPAEPTGLKRSRSLAAVSSFLRSKSTHNNKQASANLPPSLLPPRGQSSNSFWSNLLKVKRKDRADHPSSSDATVNEKEKKITMMMRSKSVGMGIFSNFGSFIEGAGGRSTTKATKVKALKQSKAAKVNNDNSPL